MHSGHECKTPMNFTQRERCRNLASEPKLRMADSTNKVPTNVPGAYYVDTECIDCDMCREIAPATFCLDDELGRSRVYRQPSTAAEIELAEEALRGCPVDAIGRDGAMSLG